MTPDELAATLKAAGLSQKEAARLLAVNRLTIYRWLKGVRAIHPSAAAYLRHLLEEHRP